MVLSSFNAQQEEPWEEPIHSDVTPTIEEEGFSNLDEISNDPQVTDVSGDTNKLSRFAALFLLNAKERFQLTQSSLDFITQQIQQLISFAIDDIAEIVSKYLNKQGVREIPSFTEQLESFRNPFMHLQTEYMQKKFYRENFKLVVSAHNVTVLCT